MGVAFGTFLPGDGYAQIRHVFMGVAPTGSHDQAGLDTVYAPRDALGLQLRAPDGTLLNNVTLFVHDGGAPEALDPELLELEVVAYDDESWRAFARHLKT